MTHSDPTPKNRAGWNAQSDSYQSDHREQLSKAQTAWGVWAIAESELNVLGNVAGLDVLEFGCGAAEWSFALEEQGARVVAMDLSERQLAHARKRNETRGNRVSLVHANAEGTPFQNASFDIVFCDHGATTFARPEYTVAEAARLLRPGGMFAFNISSPWLEACWDYETDKASTTLRNDYFSLGQVDEENLVSFQLPFGAWIRLFRQHGLVVEDLIEIRPSSTSETTYTEYVPLEWARKWPAETLWKLSKER